MKYKILLVEDNAIIAEATKDTISTMEDFVVKDIAYNFAGAISALQSKDFDLAIIDINLSEEKTGIDVAKDLSKKGIPYLFLTSYSDKKTLAKAIVYSPAGYLVKPIQKNALFANLEMLRMKFLDLDKITLLNGKNELELRVSHIRYIRSVGNYCEIHTVKDKILIRSKLADFPKKHAKLIRVHKSYVVQESMIDKKTKKQITLSCGTAIPISAIYI